jgi:prepilin-type N-terminal cleavage/methylation domain-containing protein
VESHANALSNSRRGATLPELIVVLTLIGIVLGMSLPSLMRGLDRIETRAAVQETASAFFVARSVAVVSGRGSDVVIDEARSTVLVIARGDTALALHLGARHGVAVSTTRPRMTYTAAGLGYGGANLRIVLTRGSAAESVFVSREGRVKVGSRGR